MRFCDDYGSAKETDRCFNCDINGECFDAYWDSIRKPNIKRSIKDPLENLNRLIELMGTSKRFMGYADRRSKELSHIPPEDLKKPFTI